MVLSSIKVFNKSRADSRKSCHGDGFPSTSCLFFKTLIQFPLVSYFSVYSSAHLHTIDFFLDSTGSCPSPRVILYFLDLLPSHLPCSFSTEMNYLLHIFSELIFAKVKLYIYIYIYHKWLCYNPFHLDNMYIYWGNVVGKINNGFIH